MRIMKRDIELMRWINGFGFVCVEQVCRWMGVGKRVGSRRVKKLEDMGLVKRERVLFRGGSIVMVTGDGVKLIGDELGVLKCLRMGCFEHDKQLVDLSMDLMDSNNGSWFLSERRVRHELGLKGVGQIGHVPDGYLVLENNDRIAVELELTRKQKARLGKIISGFQANLKIKGVWYYCTKSVAELVQTCVGNDDLFQVHVLERSSE